MGTAVSYMARPVERCNPDPTAPLRLWKRILKPSALAGEERVRGASRQLFSDSPQVRSVHRH
jgi:hypothetical protein